jgi:HTH-type transcriptional regulator, sugar sensing transcriptional regulator
MIINSHDLPRRVDTKLLEQIGLTDGETKVYLSLLELGTTTTGPLVKTAGISASKAYGILDRLAKKGLVGHVMKGGVKHFQATEPKRIVDYVAEKERELAEKKLQILSLLPELELRQNMGAGKRTAEIYEGKKGVTNLFLNILDDLKPGEEYFVIGAGYGFDDSTGLRNFFQKYHSARAKQKIKVNMLANHSVKDKLVPATREHSEIRFLPEELITSVQITFYKEKTFIVLWSKDPVGVLIHNQEIVQGFNAYFNLFWHKAQR